MLDPFLLPIFEDGQPNPNQLPADVVGPVQPPVGEFEKLAISLR